MLKGKVAVTFNFPQKSNMIQMEFLLFDSTGVPSNHYENIDDK